MGDLNYIDRTGEVKITGQDATGLGVNYVGADASGNMTVKDAADGSVTGASAAAYSTLIGGIYNSVFPILSTGQQAAIQIDSSGRVIIRPLTSADVVSAIQSGAWTTGRTWTLASGTDSVSAVQSGTWNIGTLTSITNPVAATQSGTWTVQQGTPPWTIQGDSASGASKAGNPVQIGGVFNTTQPTVTTGQTVEAQSTACGALIVSTGVDNFNINNISGTISLPTGASTSALQTTGNTTLSTIATALTLAQGSTTSGQTGALTLAAVTTNPPTYVTAQTSPLSVTIDGDLRVADIVNTSGQYRAQSVTTSAAEALGAATILASRKMLSITPTNGTVYWGFSNSVTTSSGSPIFKNQTMTFAVGANVHVYVIAGSTTDCRIAEGS